MITGRIERYSARAAGHAGYGPFGQDIVCAAVSILEYMAAESVLELEREGLLDEEPVIVLEPGEVRIGCRPKIGAEERARQIFRDFHNGMQLLADSYPQCIAIDSGS